MELVRVSGSDFGCFSEFDLPLYEQGLVLITGTNNATEAADNNGAGKSSLFKAITWCLFGEMVGSANKADNVIRRGAKEAVVETILGADEPWTVRRFRKKGAPGLELLGPAGAVAGSKEELQARILDLVGLDYRTFRNTVLYGQGDIERFASSRLGDLDRKLMLHRVLRTDRLRGAETWARNKATALKKDQDAVRAEVEKIQGQEAEHDVAGLQAQMDAWEADRDQRAEAKLAAARAATAEGKRLKGLSAGLEALRARLAPLKADQVAAAAALDEWAGAALDALEAAAGALATVMERQRNASDQVASAEKILARLAGDACPTCTAPLKSGAGKKYIASIKADLAAHRAAATAAGAELGPLQKKVDTLVASRKALRARADTAPTIAKKIAAIEEEIREAESAEKAAKEQARRAKELVAEASAIGDEENPHEAAHEAAEERTRELKKKRIKLERRVDALQIDIAHHEFWIRGFGQRGLPSFLLDAVMPYLTDRSNHYLGILSDGDLQVEFSTTRETAKGDTRDEIDIRRRIEGFDDVDSSGGQEKKFELSTDLALMDLAGRNVERPSLILLDEVLDGLDAEGCARILRLLYELRKRHKSVFVISHDEGISEDFEHLVWVTKDANGVSTMEVRS